MQAEDEREVCAQIKGNHRTHTGLDRCVQSNVSCPRLCIVGGTFVSEMTRERLGRADYKSGHNVT